MMKLLPLCTLAVCLPWLAASQSNNLANTAFYLQTQVEQGFLLCPSGSGTLYALANDGIDMVLMEFGAEGDILSSRYMNIGVFGLDVPADMFVDSDGKLVITGNFQEDSPGNGFVLRYDPLLRKVLWAKTFLGDATLVYGVLEVGPGGNFLVCTNPHKANSDDAEFLQLDRATGQRVPGSAWRYDVGASDQFVLTLHQGDLYAIGRFSDGNGPVSQPFMRNALLKINLTTGQPVWTRLGHIAPNVEARLYGRDLVVDQDAIISTHSGNDLGAQLNRSQIFLQKTTLDGELVWLKKIDLSEFATEFAEELVSVPDGYVLYGRPLANTENALFVLKTDKNGEVLWARKFQGPGRNRMIAAAQNQLATIGNEMYATGTSEAGGITNMFLLKISADGKISDDCPAFVPTPATFTEVLNPAHYSVNPTVTASLTGIPDLAAAPSVPFFPEKEVLCQQIIGNNCQDMVDWTFTIDGFSCDAGSLSLSYTLCNSGGIAASGPVPVSFYLGNPTFGPATPLGTYALNGTLAPGECQVGALGNLSDLWFPNGLNGLHLIYGVVNDDASWAPPFSLDTFPPTGLEECDYANNLSFSAILADTPGPDLGPDQIVCQDSSATFDAGAGYFSYLWSDGSNGQTLTVSTPGEYWVETIDFCGFRRRDTVFFSFSLLPDTKFPDAALCPGESLDYAAPGFDNYLWSPAAGLSCTNCPSVTIQPQATTQYVLVATSNLGCVLRDTFLVTVNGASNLALNCPANQTVTVGAGVSTVPVQYNFPGAPTDCPCGPANVQLVQGLASGANFPLGPTQICFKAEDGCLTQASCCFTVTVNQTGGDEPCDVKETPCLRFEILSIGQNAAKQRTYRMRIVNKCPDPLQHILFQLPDGITADAPANNSVYTAPSGRQYEVRNPNLTPIRSIRFKTIGAGIAGGASDIFEYTLPPQAAPTFIGAVARLAPRQYFETHLNVFACDIQPLPIQDQNGERDDVFHSAPGRLRAYPNPAQEKVLLDLSAWTGQRLSLQVCDARGAILLQDRLAAAPDQYLLAMPDQWPAGLYLVAVQNAEGNREQLRLVKSR